MVETAFSLLESAHFGYLNPSSAGSGRVARQFAAPQTIEIPIRIVTAQNVDEFLAGQEPANQADTQKSQK
jgi:hypothetical protein